MLSELLFNIDCFINVVGVVVVEDFVKVFVINFFGFCYLMLVIVERMFEGGGIFCVFLIVGCDWKRCFDWI